MFNTIGAEESGEFKGVANGTLPCGKAVVVNADGTVSVVSETAASLGTESAFNSETSSNFAAVFDSSNNKHIIVYRWHDGSSTTMRYVVATVASDGSVSFGTDAVAEASDNQQISACFDSTNNRIVVAYRRGDDSDHGYALVGSLSGTEVTWGSPTEFQNGLAKQIDLDFDSTSGKVVIAFAGTSEHGTAIVGTVSGTSISFGTAVVYESASSQLNTVIYDSTNNKTVIGFMDEGDGEKGKAVVGTVSGTGISFGSTVTFHNGEMNRCGGTFDSANGKVVFAYGDKDNSQRVTAIVGTVSGTSISFGSAVVVATAGTYGEAPPDNVVFDSNANKVIVVLPYTVSGSYSNRGFVFSLSVSGTTIVADTGIDFAGATAVYPAISFDSNVNKSLISFGDGGNSEYPTAVSFSPLIQNLTSENYIGMSRGVAFQTGSAAAVGTAVQYEAGDSVYNAAAYDTNVDRVVIVYQDGGNSDHGTAIVGTVDGSDNSISFGTAVVFESAASTRQSIAFDANAQKVVIAYTDGGNSNRGTAIVGTIDSSDNSISFGSPTVFNSAATIPYSTTFDASTNKVVVGYRDSDTKGYAIVGTVSGTDISFGSEAKFNDANTIEVMSAYDANAEKIVFAYSNAGSSSAGTAIVGTVSGTDITFGSAAVFETGATSQINIGYDSDSQKVVIAYKDEGDSNYGKAVVGTVSGTSISFGSIVVFNQANTEYSNVVYDTNIDKTIITYQDLGNSNYATAIVGTISGTSISFGSETVLHSATSSYIGSVYDPDQKRVVTAVRDQGSSSGKAIIFKPSDIATTRAEVADGGSVPIDIIGSVSTNQIGLTAGQQYFVQTDGTIDTTADDPSVLAGTAISATEILVKT